MRCKKCKNNIDDDSTFCEFCGEQVVVIIGSKQDDNLNKFQNKKSFKPQKIKLLGDKKWFRLLRVVYALTFGATLISGIGSVILEEKPTKIIDKSRSLIVCNDSTKHTFLEVNEACNISTCEKLKEDKEGMFEYKKLCFSKDDKKIVAELLTAQKKHEEESNSSWEALLEGVEGVTSWRKSDIPRMSLAKIEQEFGPNTMKKEKERRDKEMDVQIIQELSKNYTVDIQYTQDEAWMQAFLFIVGYSILTSIVFLGLRWMFYYVIFGSNK